jgi:Delta3-Delta2-enoyl-CoA isomerase
MYILAWTSRIFPQSSVEQFHAAVREYLLDQMDQLVPEAVLGVKSLIRAGLREKNDNDAVNLRESYAQAVRFTTGVPYDRFGKIARKEIRHKL